MTPNRSVAAWQRALPALAAALALCALASSAQAAPTTLVFAGSISTVDAALAGSFHFGEAVSITLSYDPAAQDLIAPSPSNAAYPYISFDLHFGSYDVSFGSQFPNSVVVLNNVDQGLGPSDAFGASAFQTGAGAPVGGLPLQQGFVSLWDFTETAFSDTSLPAMPAFTAFGYRVAGLTFCSNSGCGVGSNMSSVIADITSMSAEPAVPEPSTASLVLIAVVLVNWATTRRARP